MDIRLVLVLKGQVYMARDQVESLCQYASYLDDYVGQM
jgi:hypothetical protein